MTHKDPTRWVRADHLIELQQRLAALAVEVAELAEKLAAAECIELTSVKLGQAAPKPVPKPPIALVKPEPDEPQALTKAQIEEAAKYRRAQHKLPDWLPSRISQEDFKQITRRAVELAKKRLDENRHPPTLARERAQEAQAKEPRKRIRQSAKNLLKTLSDAHGSKRVAEVTADCIGPAPTATAIAKLFGDYLGAFPSNTDAGQAFAKANAIEVKNPEQALEALSLARRKFTHSDGSVSVWRAHVAPGQLVEA